MSAVTWELSLGGDRRPLRAWGIEGASLREQSFGAGALSLRVGARAIAAAHLFPYGATVVLWRAGVRRFTGRITSPEVYGSARAEGHTYVASGGWWFLENLRYQAARKMAADPDDAASPLVDVVSPRVVLFNDVNGGALNASAQIAAALAFANGRGAGLAAGAIGITVQPPWEEASGISCAEVVKRSCRWAPDAVQWLDEAGAAPALNVMRRGDLTAVPLDLSAGDRVIELRSIRPMHEACPPGVRFFYEDIAQPTISSGTPGLPAAAYRTWSRYTSQSAGQPDLVGGINEVIELGGQFGGSPEPVPADLAASFWASVNVLNYSGEIVLKGRDAGGDDVRVGRKLRLLNGRGEWATMDAPIISCTMDLFAGVTTASFGQAPGLGAAEFVEFLRYSRLRNKSGYLDSFRTGEGVTSASSPRAGIAYMGDGGVTKGFVEIELCNPPRTIKVFAETITGGG